MDTLIDRAIKAYFRGAGPGIMQPSRDASIVEEHNGKQYVVIRDTHQVLQVYRVTPQGGLRGIQHYPMDLE